MGTKGTASSARATTEASPRALRTRPVPAGATALPALPVGAAVLGLQRAYGNQAVQRLLLRAGGAGPGRGPQVQRWHDAEHDSSTQAGLTQSGQGAKLAQIFGGPTGANDGRYDTAPKLAARLGDASVNMDRFTPQVKAGPERESHNVGRLGSLAMFGGSIVTSTMGRGLSQLGQMVSGPPQTPYAVGDPLPARGILGEGANHAEFGDYRLPLNASSAGNTQGETRFINASIDALDSQPLTPDKVDEALNRLGDAAHISADRGSHGEGAKGAGHDTPYPPPGREGQTLMPHYMEGWEDNDDPALNPAGYTYGVNATANLFGRFVAAAAARNWPRPPPQIPPRQNRAPLQNRPPVPDFDPLRYPPRGGDKVGQ